MKINRRNFLPLAGAGALGGAASLMLNSSNEAREPAQASAVSILRASSYTEDLVGLIGRGLDAHGVTVKGKKVILKPNLVEYDHVAPINTSPLLIAAAYDVFRSRGAAEVVIAEGPGHRRDAIGLAEQAGYRDAVEKFETRFVDLNRDDVSPAGALADLDPFYFPNTVLGADLIVSLAKMKTHHWAGATLSMKNLFGLVPGSVYGWPKNQLHHIGIDRSIVELNRRFRNTFAIVDGIVAMEGNGPIQGTPRPCGVVVMGPDVVAVDATCCRIMGIEPEKVVYLGSSKSLGNLREPRIEQRGEAIASVRQKFALLPRFNYLRSA